MHTEELGVSHALGKVQSGLQSITRRKTSKMSLTPEKNEDEQEITKKSFEYWRKSQVLDVILHVTHVKY